jgi:mannose-6-phosphate isomerase-like protein (cupin superfamily)
MTTVDSTKNCVFHNEQLHRTLPAEEFGGADGTDMGVNVWKMHSKNETSFLQNHNVALLDIESGCHTSILFTARAEISYLVMRGEGEITFSTKDTKTSPLLDEKSTMRTLGGKTYSLKPLCVATIPQFDDHPMDGIHQITNLGKDVLRIARVTSPQLLISTTYWMYNRKCDHKDYVVNSMYTDLVRPNDGVEIHEIANGLNQSGLKTHSAAIVTIMPQAYTIAHYHPPGIEESYVILSGQAKMMIDGGKYLDMTNGGQDMFVGDIVTIPPQVAHQIINAGTTPLQFVVYSAPQWKLQTEIPITGSKDDLTKWPGVTKRNGWKV